MSEMLVMLLMQAASRSEELAAHRAAGQVIGFLLLVWGIVYAIRRSRRKP